MFTDPKDAVSLLGGPINRLATFSAIVAGITSVHCQVRAEVLEALAKGEPIRRSRPYVTGEMEPGTWSIEAEPADSASYRRLVVTITCKDDTVLGMLKAAWADDSEPVYLDPQGMTALGGDVLQCTIAGARDDHADRYAEMFSAAA